MNLKTTAMTGLLLLLASAGAYYLGTLSGREPGGGSAATSGRPKIQYTF